MSNIEVIKDYDDLSKVEKGFTLLSIKKENNEIIIFNPINRIVGKTLWAKHKNSNLPVVNAFRNKDFIDVIFNSSDKDEIMLQYPEYFI